MSLLRKILPTLTLSTMLLGGCGGTATSTGDSSVAADSNDTADSVSALTSVTTTGVDVTTTTGSDQAAQLGATGTATSFTNSSTCLTKTLLGNVATYTMNKCTGPYGLVNVTGTLVATYTLQGSGATASLQVQLAGANIQVNNATINIAATATITGPVNNRTAQVSTTTSAVGSRGNSISHSGMYTASWDGMCISLTGSFATKANLLNWSTDISNYKRCVNMCPASGTVTLTSGLNVLSITYSGTSTAQIDVNGKAGTLQLTCG